LEPIPIRLRKPKAEKAQTTEGETANDGSPEQELSRKEKRRRAA